MSELPETDAQSLNEGQPSWWRRFLQAALPGRRGRRWDRLPERSQKDASHYNMRSGL
jgi:hypothetical protein